MIEVVQDQVSGGAVGANTMCLMVQLIMLKRTTCKYEPRRRQSGPREARLPRNGQVGPADLTRACHVALTSLVSRRKTIPEGIARWARRIHLFTFLLPMTSFLEVRRDELSARVISAGPAVGSWRCGPGGAGESLNSIWRLIVK